MWRAFWPITLEAEFSQTYSFHIDNMRHHLISSSLKCQIFHFWSKFVSLTQLFRQQTQFSKLSLCHFLVYGKISSCKKIEEIHRVDPKENASQTNGQTDRWMIRTDFIEPYCKAGDSIMFFRNSRVKFGNNQ